MKWEKVSALMAKSGLPTDYTLELLATRDSFLLEKSGACYRVHCSQADRSIFLFAGSAAVNVSRRIFPLLEKNNFDVPQVLGRDEKHSLAIFEVASTKNLRDLLAEKRSGSADRARLLESVIDLFVNLSRVALGEGDKKSLSVYDAERHFYEVERLLKHLRGVAANLGVESPVSFELEMFLKSLCESMDQLCSVGVVYGDFRSDAVMVRFEGETPRLTLANCQQFGMGSPYFDIASLLYDPQSAFSMEEREGLLDRFLRFAELEGTVGVFYLQALQRSLSSFWELLYGLRNENRSEIATLILRNLDFIEEIVQRARFPDSCFLFVIALRKRLLPKLLESDISQ